MTTQELQTANIEFTMKRPGAKLESYKDIQIVTFTGKIRDEDKPSLKVWRGRAARAYANYYYASESARESAIKLAKENADGRVQYKEERKAKKAAFVPEFEVGDIFYTSWGYEQTNVEFYQVIEKVGKHTAMIHEISQEQVEDSMEAHGMACNVTAVKDSFLDKDPMKKRVGEYGIKITDSQQAWKWDGKPKYNSWYY